MEAFGGVQAPPRWRRGSSAERPVPSAAKPRGGIDFVGEPLVWHLRDPDQLVRWSLSEKKFYPAAEAPEGEVARRPPARTNGQREWSAGRRAPGVPFGPASSWRGTRARGRRRRRRARRGRRRRRRHLGPPERRGLRALRAGLAGQCQHSAGLTTARRLAAARRAVGRWQWLGWGRRRAAAGGIIGAAGSLRAARARQRHQS